MSGSRTSAMMRRTHVGMTGIDFQLLTTDQLATFLGVSTRTIEDWRLDSKGPPFVRLGARTVRYRSDAVVAWLAERDDDSGTSDRGGLRDVEA